MTRLRPALDRIWEALVIAGGRAARMPRLTKLLLGGLALLAVMLIAALAALAPSLPGTPVALSALDDLAASGRVQTATLLDQDHVLSGYALTAATGQKEGPALRAASIPAGPFHVIYPANDATTQRLITELNANGARVEIDAQQSKAVIRLLTTTLLPILILADLFALFFVARGGGGGVGEVEAFGQLDRTASVGGLVTFANVAGVEEALEELEEVVDYLKNPERYAEVGATPPKGVLLFGPPGCGKTLLARAVAGEAEVPFFSVAAAEFVESLVGVGAARVRDLFARVRAAAPAIVFIDELDAAGRRRGSGPGGGSEERDTTLNQLLVEMDGFDVSTGIVVIAATNRADILDPALLRPGRFDRHIVIDRPDLERREAILRLHGAARRLTSDVDFSVLARQTPGFSGADLANVINEAALLTIRSGQPLIDGAVLSEAIQRVLGGPQRRGHLFTEEERRRVACHEAGHAIVASLLSRDHRPLRLSIVARGRGLGSISLAREDAETIRTERQMRGRIAIALAGRVAEELEFREPSTGAADDLEHATHVAREMAGRHGMAHEVGLASVFEGQGDSLGQNGFATPAASEAGWSAFDTAVRRLLDEGHATAATLLRGGKDELALLTERLLEFEQLEGAALDAVLPEPLGDAAIKRALANGAARARSGNGGRTAKAATVDVAAP